MSGDPENELAAVISSAQELLRWEETLGGQGFPTPEPPSPSEAPLVGPGTHGSDPDIQPRLQVLADEAAECTRCELSRGRTKSVFARGASDTDLVFVGEGPGFHEDQEGLPFVGRAGQLLDRMVAAMGYDRDGVYICNVVKCRPPDNRTPLPTEAAACAHFLVPQLDLVQPKVIVALGRVAAQSLIGTEQALGKLRGRWHEVRGVPTLVTYHPAALLRNPGWKRPTWEDMQQARDRLRDG